MHHITFFPLGNANTTLIETKSGQRLLFDYMQTLSGDEDDKRINLNEELNKVLNKESYFDVVSISHLDSDHCQGFSEYFFLEHAKKYQGNSRIRIGELWIPAAIILETEKKDKTDLTEDQKALRAEARYRLKEGKAIKILSKPRQLEEWCEKESINLEDKEELFVDAGQRMPNYNINDHGIEVFVHSPFSGHVDENNEVDRNEAGSIFHVTVGEGNVKTKIILSADNESDVWSDIVKTTEYHKNAEYLEWDIFLTSHHCSYKSLNNEDKGDNMTKPEELIKKLFEKYGRKKSHIIASSKVIPTEDTKQPPHYQAANYYKDIAKKHNGRFLITMQYPEVDNPKPLKFKISKLGVQIEKKTCLAGFTPLLASRSRAG